jgi:hypothetical protein
MATTAELEYWNTGMMEYWALKNWDVGPLEKCPVDMGGNISSHNIPPY